MHLIFLNIWQSVDLIKAPVFLKNCISSSSIHDRDYCVMRREGVIIAVIALISCGGEVSPEL